MGIVAFLILLLFPQVLQWLFGSNELVAYGGLTGALLFAWLFGFFLEIVATANQDVGYSSAFIVLSQLTRAIVIGGAALLFGTLSAVLWSALFQGLLQGAIMLWYLEKRFPGFSNS